jgi:hypothetical protein
MSKRLDGSRIWAIGGFYLIVSVFVAESVMWLLPLLNIAIFVDEARTPACIKSTTTINIRGW